MKQRQPEPAHNLGLKVWEKENFDKKSLLRSFNFYFFFHSLFLLKEAWLSCAHVRSPAPRSYTASQFCLTVPVLFASWLAQPVARRSLRYIQSILLLQGLFSPGQAYSNKKIHSRPTFFFLFFWLKQNLALRGFIQPESKRKHFIFHALKNRILADVKRNSQQKPSFSVCEWEFKKKKDVCTILSYNFN